MTFERAGSVENCTSPSRLHHAVNNVTETRRQWRAWTETEPALTGVAGVAGLVTELHTGTALRRDELLAAVVRLAQHGPYPDTALLVLVRCLWPGLCHRRQLHRHGMEPDEATAILLAGLVEAVTDYDLAARPDFIANRLLIVPTRRLQRAARNRDEATAPEDIPETSSGVPEIPPGVPELSDAGLLRVAIHARIITLDDAWLIHATRVGGISLTAAAQRLGLTYSTAWRHRRQAELRWITWWAPEHLANHRGAR